ncbi:hypothetical protein [Rhizobium sp. BK376]|uniref:hypothetical protein n=1 Tax=Rhizobium sp. BK376 TaxID=2512149 RepID=UPI001049FC0D|nr:hypothetical protein [Rhizobium sp. BK376]TCR85274.1 hypothetical protein EV561_10745 [Rhizobium sp. BK376]
MEENRRLFQSHEFHASIGVQLCIALVAGSIISLQIAVMRVFAVGSWAHFGSLVVSLAMLAFSLSSMFIFAFREWIEHHWRIVTSATLWSMGPLTVLANLLAQQLPFNAIFIVSDPTQKWRLLANFLLYLLPFLSGAMFLGTVFLKGRSGFNRLYFADLTGSGVGGLFTLGALYLLSPEDMLLSPLALWACGGLIWFLPKRATAASIVGALVAGTSIAAFLCLPRLLDVPPIAVSQYKGISYARNFPDATRLFRNVSPFGDLQIYKSAYMHFAPGLSDNAAFNMPEVPSDAFLGLYIDGDGPEGIMRDLPPENSAYYEYLPAHYPYVVKAQPKAFIVEFGGGISSRVALHARAQSVTAAESNPAVVAALRNQTLKSYLAGLIDNPALNIVAGDGRLYLSHTGGRYDVIDLSLAGSVGLSNPGGFAIVERYAYTQEAMTEYINALADGGILSVTAWNKEDPPKSVLKLYATMAAAAEASDPNHAAQSFFVVSSYLSTTTVLYKKAGFSTSEIDQLRAYTRSMSFDEIYSPGFANDAPANPHLLGDIRSAIFGSGPTTAIDDASSSDADPGAVPPDDDAGTTKTPLPSTSLARLAWSSLMGGDWTTFQRDYAFDVSALSDNRPYFAGYEKLVDLPKTLDRLDLFQDDWGYLVLWVTLGIATVAAGSLILFPVIFQGRSPLARMPGKVGSVLYFACLGLGYIMVEVGLISRFTQVLANPTISASVLISCLLIFSGIGSLCSERVVEKPRHTMPPILIGIAIVLCFYAAALPTAFSIIGGLPYGLRILICALLVAPPAFLMGFPMATGMSWLARLGKEPLFVWAWGVNGCFSVVGAALVPIIATSVGFGLVMGISAFAYALAAPAFFSILKTSGH